MIPPVRVPQFHLQPRRRRRRNLHWIVHRIQIGNQRYRQPVVSVNPVIPAQHHARLAIPAGPQLRRRFRAYMVQINSGVPRRIHCPKLAKRLFQQQRGIRPRRSAAQDGHHHQAQQNLPCASHIGIGLNPIAAGLLQAPFLTRVPRGVTSGNPPCKNPVSQ